MDENTVNNLINTLEEHANSLAVTRTQLQQCREAIVWAEASQRWDLIVPLTSIVIYHLEFSHQLDSFWDDQGSIQFSNEMRESWEEARRFADKGLIAAKKIENEDKYLEFIQALSRLCGRLNDFERALDYLEQELSLLEPKHQEDIARKFYLLGNKATAKGNNLLARKCYQKSLEIYQRTNNIYAIVDIIPFLIANEINHRKKASEAKNHSDTNLEVIIDAFWKLRDSFQYELELNKKGRLGPALNLSLAPLYEQLQKNLTALKSLG